MKNQEAGSETRGKKGRNPWGFFAFVVSMTPFLIFASMKGNYTNYLVVRYSLVISGFIGVFLSAYAFMVEKRGILLSRLGVFFAVLAALLGASIGILALLPIVMNLQ